MHTFENCVCITLITNKGKKKCTSWYPKLQHSLGELLHRLPDTQISQDLLRTTQDGIELVRPVEHFDDLAHARLGDTTASEDVGGVVSNLLCGVGGVRLEQTDRTTQVGGLFGVGHVAHLVGDRFEPGLVGFTEGDHPGESVAVSLVYIQ